MSIELYDAALLKKLQGWTRDTHISITGVDESTRLFSSIIDQQNDKKCQESDDNPRDMNTVIHSRT